MVPKMLIVVMLAGSACAATWMGYEPMKPKELAHKKGCYIEEIKDVIPYGTTLTPQGHCYRIHCSQGMVDYASCGVIFTDDKNCHKVEDLTKPYPDCCPTFKCETENEIES